MFQVNIYQKLQSSSFRRGFFLSSLDKEHINEFGMDEMVNLAYNLVNRNLRSNNDMTFESPYKGNPVYVAQHATATCCRKCLFKYYRIPTYRDLTENEVKYIVRIIVKWILKQTG